MSGFVEEPARAVPAVLVEVRLALQDPLAGGVVELPPRHVERNPLPACVAHDVALALAVALRESGTDRTVAENMLGTGSWYSMSQPAQRSVVVQVLDYAPLDATRGSIVRSWCRSASVRVRISRNCVARQGVVATPPDN